MLLFIFYLLESTVCLSIFYVLYKYLLYRQSYFEWNRYYLILIVFISCLIPFVHMPVSIIAEELGIRNYEEILTISPIGGEAIIRTKSNSRFQFYNSRLYKFSIYTIAFLFWIFVIGAARKLFIFARTIIKTILLIKNNTKEKHNEYCIINSKSKIPAFSFFKYIIVNENHINLSTEEQEQVIKHEIVHIVQHHTIDILLFELLGVIYWFNPIMRDVKATVREVHEYIVDSVVIGTHDHKGYANLLLKLSVKRIGRLIVNNFSKNQLKNRLIMMKDKETDYLRKLKFLIVLPLLLLVMIVFGFAKDMVHDLSGLKYEKTNSDFVFPLESGYEIVQSYYIDQKVKKIYKDKNGNDIINYMKVSHPEITFKTESSIPVFAAANGIIEQIKSFDNWGVDEKKITIIHDNNFSSEYKGLYKVMIKIGDKVSKGDTIAITGDKRLYPTMSFKLLINRKPVNPNKIINHTKF